MKWILPTIVACLLTLLPSPVRAQPATTRTEFAALVAQLQAAVLAADTDRFLALLDPTNDPAAAREFARDALRPGVTAAAVQLRFVVPLEDRPEGTGYDLMVEVFTETDNAGRLQTWQLYVIEELEAGADSVGWRITVQRNLDTIDGLHHLTLGETTQYDATDLVVTDEDLTLRMRSGSVFVVEQRRGITGMVLIGDGVMTFSPQPASEKGQLRIFSGDETLDEDFDSAFLRFNPAMFSSRVSPGALVEVPVDADELELASETFDEFAPLSFAIDLSDLSDKSWWLTPGSGDFIGEIGTERLGVLTYTRAQNRPEDVSLHERASQRLVSLYSSARNRAVHGRYFSDAVSYDVLDYDIRATFAPEGYRQDSLRSRPELSGSFIDGTTRIALRVTRLGLSTLTLRLADELQVHSVTSREFGPLLYIRMRGRNNVVVNLPSGIPDGADLSLIVRYSGLLPGQVLEERWIGRQRFQYASLARFGVAERRYIYSNSSYWYPQSTVSDFATATMDLTVPADYGVVASGEPEEGNPPVASVEGATGERRFSFVTLQPARYLSCVISRFVPEGNAGSEVSLADEVRESTVVRPGVSYDSVSLKVTSNERSRERIDELHEKSADIIRFYAGLTGDVPYPSFTLALTDSFLPGGHSPAYFAVLNQPLPMASGLMMTWQTDPVAFSGYPSFFLAHELAHQWWGQAVGWKNYHEQWLSEGIAQYFAALYAHEEERSTLEDGERGEVFADVLAQMRRWSIRHSDKGPIYLGYRLGHIKGEPRVFRALVYNKGAMVLHMLRRLIGDETFFSGIRRLYNDMRFQKAGTDDLIRAFETEAGRSLEGFFERWIHDSDLPEVRFSYRTEPRLSGRPGETDVLLTFEQDEPLFEIPLTVTLRYRDGREESIVVPVTERVTEVRVPVTGPLRGVDVNEDNGALAEIDR
jgi:hypothetical protein